MIFWFTQGPRSKVGYLSDTFDNAGTLAIGKGAGGSGAGDFDIANSISLNGGGTVQLGESGTAGDILDFPGASSSDSLANVDNTIKTVSGSTGLISLDDSFDNQSSGTVESASFLQIIAPTLTNEGAMTAEAGATLDLSGSSTFTNSGTMIADASGGTLDLGGDGATETLTNYRVDHYRRQRHPELAISGNLTITGSGGIYLKGAGAEITSDGSAATFTNASTIDALASGQIGDSHLTFVNNGTTGASVRASR